MHSTLGDPVENGNVLFKNKAAVDTLNFTLNNDKSRAN
jgi:hypothetical protein